MNVTVEIHGWEEGTGKDGRDWVRLWDRHQSGTYGRHLLFGPPAEALKREVARLLDPGQEVTTARLIVALTGEWKDNGASNGQKRTRNFYADTFAILSGPALEIARLRRNALDVFKAAEAHRAEGRLGHAYKAAMEFVSAVSGKSIDLVEIEKEIAEEDDLEFGPIEDPEAVAAARYAALDAPASVEKLEVAKEDVLDDVPASPEADAAVGPESTEAAAAAHGEAEDEAREEPGQEQETSAAPEPEPVRKAPPRPTAPAPATQRPPAPPAATHRPPPPPVRRPGM